MASFRAAHSYRPQRTPAATSAKPRFARSCRPQNSPSTPAREHQPAPHIFGASAAPADTPNSAAAAAPGQRMSSSVSAATTLTAIIARSSTRNRDCASASHSKHQPRESHSTTANLLSRSSLWTLPGPNSTHCTSRQNEFNGAGPQLQLPICFPSLTDVFGKNLGTSDQVRISKGKGFSL